MTNGLALVLPNATYMAVPYVLDSHMGLICIDHDNCMPLLQVLFPVPQLHDLPQQL